MHGLLLDNIHDSQKGNTLIAIELLVPSFLQLPSRVLSHQGSPLPSNERLAAGDEAAVTCMQKVEAASKDELDQGSVWKNPAVHFGLEDLTRQCFVFGLDTSR